MCTLHNGGALAPTKIYFGAPSRLILKFGWRCRWKKTEETTATEGNERKSTLLPNDIGNQIRSSIRGTNSYSQLRLAFVRLENGAIRSHNLMFIQRHHRSNASSENAAVCRAWSVIYWQFLRKYIQIDWSQIKSFRRTILQIREFLLFRNPIYVLPDNQSGVQTVAASRIAHFSGISFFIWILP